MTHGIEFFIKINDSLGENKTKTKLNNNFQNISKETIFMNTENSKMDERNKFFLNFSEGIDLISRDKHSALQNLSIY